MTVEGVAIVCIKNALTFLLSELKAYNKFSKIFPTTYDLQPPAWLRSSLASASYDRAHLRLMIRIKMFHLLHHPFDVPVTFNFYEL